MGIADRNLLYIIIFILLLLCIAVFIMMWLDIRIKVEKLKGIEKFRSVFNNRVRYKNASFNVVLLGVDFERLLKYEGKEELNKYAEYVHNILKFSIAKNSYNIYLYDGCFCLLINTDETKCNSIVLSILKRANEYSDILKNKYGIIYRAGIYHIADSSVNSDDALRAAKIAYEYCVRDNLSIYFVSQQMIDNENKKERIHRSLLSALENREFQPFVQPIVNSDGKYAGGEVLSRWLTSENSLINPNEYIAEMIQADLIDNLDFSMLEATCRKLQECNNDLWLTCNFTRVTLSRTDFRERFEAIVQKYNFDRTRLYVEITEDSKSRADEILTDNLNYCKKLGVNVALDDLGSGYSSIADLCDYPIDLIKIDRFIVQKTVDEKGFNFLKGFIELAHDLGIKVLCEGVESRLQNEMVLRASADYIQGYFYARVLPIDEADSFFLKYNSSITNQGVDNGKENGNYQELP